MKKMLTLGFLSLLTTVLAQERMKLMRTIPLPDVTGRFDHFACDIPGQRLFIAALGHNTLEVVNLKSGNRIQSIRGLRKPTGVAFVVGAHQIYVGNGDDGTCKIFDGASFQLVKQIESLDDADNVRYDPSAKVVYLGYGDGVLGMIDVPAMKLVGEIRFKGHPESFQLEKNGDRIFINVPETREITVVERSKRTVTAHWPLKNFKANFPMALDETNHRLFVGCRTPARLLVINTDSGQIMSDLAVSGDTDDLFYDSANKLIYVSGGEGSISVVEQSGADDYKVSETIPTAPGARTSFFIAELKLFCLAVPKRGAQQAEIRIFNTR